MSPYNIQMLAILPLGFLVIADGPASTIALYGLLITTVGGLIGRWIDARVEARRHAWDIEERCKQAQTMTDQAKQISEDLLSHRKKLAEALAENTAITRANADMSEKLLAKETTVADTNETAHRIEQSISEQKPEAS